MVIKKTIKKTTNYQLGMAHKSVFKNGVAFDEGSNTYQVKSNSQKNKVYLVTKKGKLLECECIGFGYNDNCSHCVAVRIFQRTGLKWQK